MLFRLIEYIFALPLHSLCAGRLGVCRWCLRWEIRNIQYVWWDASFNSDHTMMMLINFGAMTSMSNAFCAHCLRNWLTNIIALSFSHRCMSHLWKTKPKNKMFHNSRFSLIIVSFPASFTSLSWERLNVETLKTHKKMSSELGCVWQNAHFNVFGVMSHLRA